MKRICTLSRRILKSWLLFILLTIFHGLQAGMSHAVDVAGSSFTPSLLNIQVGDTVIWTNSEGLHNVNGTRSAFLENPESFGNSVGSDWVYSHVFNKSGTYNYQCDVHAGLGMSGTITVAEIPPDTLSVNFSGMDPHVGQTLWLAVTDADSHEEIARLSRTVATTFSVSVPGIMAGHSYTVDFFSDHNGNGHYDAPPADHAWRLEIAEAEGNEELNFVHNTGFKDIEWEHRVLLNLSGMIPHLGQEAWFALIETSSGKIIDRKSEMVRESFSVDLREIVPGNSYRIDFFSDHNHNGYYDSPPGDHAWSLSIKNASGDESLDFSHNTNFTDIDWQHRLKLEFSGMNPHVGQKLTLFLRELPGGSYVDTVVVDTIPDAAFSVESFAIQPGKSYLVDFFSDHNRNGLYDVPPADHAWRLQTSEISGDEEMEFIHNTGFTDIMKALGPHVKLAENPGLGNILTDADGFTLYFFTGDVLPDSSLCTGDCNTNWPPFHVEDPEIGEGLDPGDFSVIRHPEGGMQSTYKGWPLYKFVNDLNPGDTKGEAVNEVWFVARPDYIVMLLDGFLTGEDGVTYNSDYTPGEEIVRYFVDGRGMTLYAWTNDSYKRNNFTSPDFSNNTAWPIYEADEGKFASSLDTILFDVIEVHGKKQLTYRGWPLYHYGSDSLRGNTLGVSLPSPGIWPVAVRDMGNAPEITNLDPKDQEAGISVYPNPSSGSFTIDSEIRLMSVEILSLAGVGFRKTDDIDANSIEMSVFGLNHGIYLLRIRTADGKMQISRLVIR